MYTVIKHSIIFCAFLLVSLLIPAIAKAQIEPEIKLVSASTVTVTSKILNEKRKIYIYTPPADSANINKHYPVLYVLDADNHFGMMAEFCRYLSHWNVDEIPEMIVVGIVNTDRRRDLTPSHSIYDYSGKPDTSSTSLLKSSGGNEQFFQFIKQELIPFINLTCKTQPFKIFAGHSFGGITVVNCLLTHPDMFNAYMAVSPSFWWDRRYLLKLADKKLEQGSTLNKKLFYSDGNEGVAFHTDLLKFDSLLSKKKILGLDHKYSHYPDDTHMTEPPKAYYDGLRFIFKEWPMLLQDNSQIKASTFTKHYQQLSQLYGYTILPNEITINTFASYLILDATTQDNAIGLFEMNTVNYPRSSNAFTSLGDAWVTKGVKEKAIACYKKALELKPSATNITDKIKALKNKK
ncbi:MAG: alpha/beta hydrolase-fold protein [Mucilaginibacter sp.]|uniref:alpha/beta hydrolase-fold protein n=1 Tax=Mucilaginibacter sp. TaxID=1882438 RepID=UPI003264FD75